MASSIQIGDLDRREAEAKFATYKARRFPPLSIADNGKVRIGGQGPIFRLPAIADLGKVRVGGQGPIFR